MTFNILYFGTSNLLFEQFNNILKIFRFTI